MCGAVCPRSEFSQTSAKSPEHDLSGFGSGAASLGDGFGRGQKGCPGRIRASRRTDAPRSRLAIAPANGHLLRYDMSRFFVLCVLVPFVLRADLTNSVNQNYLREH